MFANCSKSGSLILGAQIVGVIKDEGKLAFPSTKHNVLRTLSDVRLSAEYDPYVVGYFGLISGFFALVWPFCLP